MSNDILGWKELDSFELQYGRYLRTSRTDRGYLEAKSHYFRWTVCLSHFPQGRGVRSEGLQMCPGWITYLAACLKRFFCFVFCTNVLIHSWLLLLLLLLLIIIITATANREMVGNKEADKVMWYDNLCWKDLRIIIPFADIFILVGLCLFRICCSRLNRCPRLGNSNPCLKNSILLARLRNSIPLAC